MRICLENIEKDDFLMTDDDELYFLIIEAEND